MNKEIAVKKIQVSGILFKYHVPISEANIICTFIEDLEQQVKKQKEIIDKAIEFLYKIKFDKTDKYICISEYIEYQQLLDILKKEK